MFNVSATKHLSKLYDEIIHVNFKWKTPEKHQTLNLFMTRLLFCMFVGNVDKDFPYINNDLFADVIEVPFFSKQAKCLMLEAAALDWQEINPDIFGSIVEMMVDQNTRSELGVHYTSESNILKVLQPLFLMSLEADFDKSIRHINERAMLNALLNRIHKIRVFDPACGSGNFLIMAYRELRKLEMRIFERQRERERDSTSFTLIYSGVKLSNFYGIELVDFAAETSKLSLKVIEYQMNHQFKKLFGAAPPDFPLNEGGHIHTGNALRLDWLKICPPLNKSDEDVETYLVGNPPYMGSKWQNKEQKEDLAHVFSPLTKKFKDLDYVAAWYLKGSQYCSSQNAECAFVVTNSICQGQQVSMLWPLIFDQGVEISFAHQSFKWKNMAARNAGVTCVIAGLRRQGNKAKYLYEGNSYRTVDHIGSYLIEMPDIIVCKATSPFNGLPVMLFGDMPRDGGNLILSSREKLELIKKYPQAASFVRRLYGSQELIKGIERYCLWIEDLKIEDAHSIPPIHVRIEQVRKERLRSNAPSTRDFANRPHRFVQIQRNSNSEHAIIIPRVSSDNRPYIPIGLITDGGIIIDSAFAIYDAEPYLFAIISSTTHLSWIKAVCGQLETRLRYSNTLGYNTFPIPPLSNEQKQTLETHAWEIITAREAYHGKTIAWLYDPKTMPQNLLSAHQALDDTLEKIYIGRPFKNDTERLEHLFKRYAEMLYIKK